MNSVLQQTPIAIIGMAGLFPEADSLQQYWDNILNGRDCITQVPPSRWAIEDYYDADPLAPDKTYCKVGGFVPDIEFDPLEFGLPPNILEVTDVSQLLALVVAKSALKDANYGEASDAIRERTGVVLGVGGGQKLITPLTSRLHYPMWNEVMEASGLSASDAETISEKIRLGHVGWNEDSFPGFLGNVIAGRVANRLDLGGINCVVDAACASSLSALNLAVRELVEHRSDMMITGGVDTDNSIFMYMCFSKTPALSQSGQTRPFDAEADGMLLGEAIGMLVLKRLDDAERDGDRIYGVIKGIGSSSDGRYNSIYAPRASGQELALRRAYEDAGFAPETVGLIEAHGTGTKAGDPVELAALKTVFGKANSERPTIALGSVKSQIGHTKSAAGAASLIKTVLALHHKILPPTINVNEPAAGFDDPASPLYLNTQPRPWLSGEDQHPRRAGVSSFGFGGTNFHIALEEYQPEQQRSGYRIHRTPHTILLDAADRQALLNQCRQWLDRLGAADGERHFQTLVADSRARSIPATSARLGFTAISAAEATSRLQAVLEHLPAVQDDEWTHPEAIFFRSSSVAERGKVVALFSGQGAQYVEMGRTLTQNFPQMRHAYDELDRLLTADGLASLSSVVFPNPTFSPEERTAQDTALRNTAYAQPAIGAFSSGLYSLLQQAGLAPDYVAGHSFGELTALWAAGALSETDYFALVKARGLAMAAPSDEAFDAGAMLAVHASAEVVQELIEGEPDVALANLNGPNQTVLAGPGDAMTRVEENLASLGLFTTALPVSAAFHTPLVSHAQQPFAQAIDQITFNTPQIPIYANSSGLPYPDQPQEMADTLGEQMLSPVLFQQTIENLYADGGYTFIEIGPKSTLTNLVKDILKDRPHLSVAVNANPRRHSDRQLRDAVVQLRVAGLPLHDFDEYALVEPPILNNTKPRFTVGLNGSNYVSKATRQAYSDALSDDFTITPSANGVNDGSKNGAGNGHMSATDIPQIVQPAPTPSFSPPPARTETIQSEVQPVMEASATNGHHIEAPQVIQSNLDGVLTQFSTIQAEMLDAHQRYLEQNLQQTETFFHLIQQQHGSAQNGAGVAQLAQSMSQFQEHQTETLRVHEHYLDNQLTYLDLLFKLIQQERATSGAPISPPPIEPLSRPTAEPTNGNGKLATLLGPPDWSDPGQDVVWQQAPPPVVPSNSPVPVQPWPDRQPAPVKPALAPDVVAPPVTPSAALSTLDVTEVADRFMQVVSEKTGYPVELLDLAQDMETDLGIDSIKRVEILGAMQDRIPHLPRLRADELAELRTLQQVVDYVFAQSVQQPEPSTVPVAEQAIIPTETPSLSPTSLDAAGITDLFKEVVSEKTGYPVELLDLAQDMETDLGIDSIKRVEILGAVQERIPGLPRLRADELAELRTLQQVVDYVHAQSEQQPGPTTTPVIEQAASPASSLDSADVTHLFKEVVSEKTGYPVELLDLAQDMETDLGIDSIKRVEILGAVQERIPGLPRLRADELAELRTLHQVVDYVFAQFGQQQNAPVIEVPVVSAEAPPTLSSAELTQLFREVVSEKTGYPVELLEMQQDMETDLGIDSIKRVEILGAMQERIPSLPRLRADELAELRTLQQVVDYVEQQMLAGSDSSPAQRTTVDSPAAATVDTNGFEARLDVAPVVAKTEEPSVAVDELAVELKRLPAPDSMERPALSGHCALLTDDGSETTGQLASKLLAQGWPVAVLSFPSSLITPCVDLPAGADRYQLGDMNEEQIIDRLAQIQHTHGPVALFIHLNRDWSSQAPTAVMDPTSWLSAAEESIVAQIFLVAKHLQQPLMQSAEQGMGAFIAVTRLDGSLGLDKQARQPFGAAGGGLFGLVKSLNLEWGPVFCRALDIAPSTAAEETVESILAELHDPNLRLTEVGYGRQGRVTLTASRSLAQADASGSQSGDVRDSSLVVRQTGIGHVDPLRMTDGEMLSSTAADRDQLFVVSGGARGVTAQCVIALARQRQSTFVLLGRSSLEAEPEWAHGVSDAMALKKQIASAMSAAGEQPTPLAVESRYKAILGKREIERTLQTIAAVGGQAEYVRVDVCDGDAVAQTLAEVQRRLGPITGLIHGAGVLADKRIEQKSADDLARVYAVKVDGLRNLLNALSPDSLQQIALFSSAAGFYGNAGQTDYALANEVLNKMAHLLSQQLPACQVRSINWGPWDGGMVTPALKKLFAERNISVIPVEIGARIFVDQLSLSSEQAVQSVVGSALNTLSVDDDAGPRSRSVRRRLREQANPFLQDHRIGGKAVLPVTCAQAWIVDTCEQLHPGLTFYRLRNLSVLKGIVFDDSLAAEYIVDVDEVEKSDEALVLDVMIRSETADGQPRYHYSATCELRAEIPSPEAARAFDFSHTRPAQAYYNDGTLFHGPMLQGLQRVIESSEHEIVLECRLPALSAHQQGQFPARTFNPYTADTLFQSLLVWVRAFHDAGSLPLRAGDSRQYRTVAFDTTFYIVAQIVERNESRVVADIAVYDKAGVLCLQSDGAEVTVSQRLNQLFESGA